MNVHVCFSVMSHIRRTRRILLMWPLTGVRMMTYHIRRNRSMNQVKMSSYLLLVRPHQLSSSSDEGNVSYEEVDACKRIFHGVFAASSIVYDISLLVGRTSGHNSFTATIAAPTRNSKIQVPDYSTYNAWKHSTPEVTLHSVIKCTNEEAYKEGENDFDLSMYEIESFIALQYVRRLTYSIFLTLKLTVF